MSGDAARALLTELTFQIHPYDVDQGAVVNNTVHVRWLEDLRCALIGRHHSVEQQLSEHVAAAVIETRVEYRRALRLTDVPVGRMWVAGFDRRRLFLEAEIATEEGVAVRAEQTAMFVRLEGLRPTAMPEPLRRALERESRSAE